MTILTEFYLSMFINNFTANYFTVGQSTTKSSMQEETKLNLNTTEQGNQLSIDQTENTYVFKQTKKEKIVTILGYIFLIIFPIALLVCFRVIQQYKRGILLRLGRIKSNQPLGPGLKFIALTDDLYTVDIRTQSINLDPQEVLTKDSVTVKVEAVIYYHVSEPVKCFMNIYSHKYASEMLAVSILRNVIGQYTLTDVLSSRDIINRELKIDIDQGTARFGVEVERVEMKDVILPLDLQKAMAAEAEGRRLAKAKLIQAEGEIKAAENLREAAQVISQNPKVMLLRYLQTLNAIAADQKSTVLFPFPLEIPETD